MTDTSNPAPSDQPLDRALAILEALAQAARPMTITDLAAYCRLPLTSTHRTAQQLEKRDLVKRALGSKKLIIGDRLIRLGSAATEAAMRTDRPHQVLVSLASTLGEACQIGIRSDNEVVYVDTARVNPSPGLHFEQGRRSPIHCTSIGKLYLANMPDEDFERWLSNTPLPQLTPNTITSKAALRAVIKQIRESQWASNNEEFLPGVVGCAVPIRLADNTLLACIGLYVPTVRMTIDRISTFIPALNDAAAQIASFSENAGDTA